MSPGRGTVAPSGGYRPAHVCSFLFQSSTRQSRVVEISQTKAVRISCCFSFQSSISRTRGLPSSTTPALKPPARRCGAIGSSGGRPPSKSCTKPTSARKTPARRRERLWWRSATGNGCPTRPGPPPLPHSLCLPSESRGRCPGSRLATLVPSWWHSFAELPGLSLQCFPSLGDVWGRVSPMLGQGCDGDAAVMLQGHHRDAEPFQQHQREQGWPLQRGCCCREQEGL